MAVGHARGASAGRSPRSSRRGPTRCAGWVRSTPRPFLFFEDLELCLRAAAAGVPTELHPEIALRHAGGHSTGPAYDGEPHALLARRRREVVGARLGRRALALDDLAQGVTFATRAIAHRGRERERAQLRALIHARRTPVTFM